MEVIMNTTDDKQNEVVVIKSIYYTIAGKRVRFHVHRSLHMLGCYSITHAKSGLKARDFPEHGHGYSGMNFAGVAKKMLH